MRNIILVLFLVFKSILIGQNLTIVEESNISVKMSLEQVSVIKIINEDYVEVANTDYIVFNYYNRYIELQPGIHRLRIDVVEPTIIVLLPIILNDFKNNFVNKRIVKNGQEDINTLTGGTSIIDYIEWTINQF